MSPIRKVRIFGRARMLNGVSCPLHPLGTRSTLTISCRRVKPGFWNTLGNRRARWPRQRLDDCPSRQNGTIAASFYLIERERRAHVANDLILPGRMSCAERTVRRSQHLE